MSLWALRAAGIAALALGFSAWRWLYARPDKAAQTSEAQEDTEADTSGKAGKEGILHPSGHSPTEKADSDTLPSATDSQDPHSDILPSATDSQDPSTAQSFLAAPSEVQDTTGSAQETSPSATTSGQLDLPDGTQNSAGAASKQQLAEFSAPKSETSNSHHPTSSANSSTRDGPESLGQDVTVGGGEASSGQQLPAAHARQALRAPPSPFAGSPAAGGEGGREASRDSPANGARRPSVSWEDEAPAPSKRRPSSSSGSAMQHMASGWSQHDSLDEGVEDSPDQADDRASASGSDDESQGQALWSEGSGAAQLDASDRFHSFPSLDYEPEPPLAPSSAASTPGQLKSGFAPPFSHEDPPDPANGMAKYINDQHRQTLPEQQVLPDPGSLLDERAAALLNRSKRNPPLGKPPSHIHQRLMHESAPPLGGRAWPRHRSIDLQPAPTEDVNGLLDEAVRELVSERAPPGLLGSRSLSDSNLSKRSSQGAEGGSGDGSGDHRGSLPVDVEADELRDRLSDVDRTNSDASASEAAAISDQQISTTTRFGLEASGGSAGLRHSSSLKRTREADESMPLALRLDVLAGPALETSYRTDIGISEVNIGRLDDNTMAIPDSEISGHHVSMRWDSASRAWQIMDVGSLNGTMLNDRIISTSNRRPSRALRLSSDDILQLGSRTKLKVTCLPHEMSQVTLPLLAPKRLSTSARHKPLHKSTTLRSDAVTRLALQAELAPDTNLSLPALGLAAAALVRTGRGRKACEDVVLCQRSLTGAPCDAALFCVFDGHHGRAAADEVKALLPQKLAQHLTGMRSALEGGAGLGEAWREVYTQVDAEIQSEDGCTATTLLTWLDSAGRTCFQVANVGDSSAILVHLDDQEAAATPARYLTADHRLTNATERDRLQALGITLGHGGTRLYGLNLGRCLGDRYLKVEDLGLSAIPHVSLVEQASDTSTTLVIIASDGVWDVASADRIIQAAMEAPGAQHGDVESMARAVVVHAQKQHTKDDVSVIVLRFTAASMSFSQFNGSSRSRH